MSRLFDIFSDVLRIVTFQPLRCYTRGPRDERHLDGVLASRCRSERRGDKVRMRESTLAFLSLLSWSVMPQ